MLQSHSNIGEMAPDRMRILANCSLKDPIPEITAAAPKLMKNIRNPVGNVVAFQEEIVKRELKRITVKAARIKKVSVIDVKIEISYESTQTSSLIVHVLFSKVSLISVGKARVELIAKVEDIILLFGFFI